jgi:signal peptidase I
VRLLFLSAAFATALFALSRAFHRYEVNGRSMVPAYAPGERLLVERVTYLVRPPRAGEVVVAQQPGADGRLDLKRVVATPGQQAFVAGEVRRLGPDEWSIEGDNGGESTDSRRLGPVRRRDIFGRAWLKY